MDEDTVVGLVLGFIIGVVLAILLMTLSSDKILSEETLMMNKEFIYKGHVFHCMPSPKDEQYRRIERLK